LVEQDIGKHPQERAKNQSKTNSHDEAADHQGHNSSFFGVQDTPFL
jgi:hypothetical protein